MRIRLSVELRIERATAETEEGPSGTESMIIHQDQPRYVGFVREDHLPSDAAP